MYEIRGIHAFDNNTSLGIDQVPLNGYVVIDNSNGTGKPKFFRLISKVGLTNTTTIGQFLANEALYKQLNPDLVPEEVLAAAKLVDGPGSGLSADDVDGIEGADITTLSAAQIIDGAKTFNSVLTVNNDIVVTGLVDGVDIAAFKASYDNLDYKTYLSLGTITGISIGISSDGSIDDVVLPTANATQAGLLSAALYNDIIANNAKITNVTTDLDFTSTAINGTVTSSDGADAIITGASVTNAGLMTAADKLKLDNIASGAATGTVTSVTAGAGMTQTGTDTIDPTLNIIAGDNSITVNPDNIVVNVIDGGEF